MSNDKNYIVLARKYRPQTFEDLIGQEVLVRTLTNGINNAKLAQSYILTGIRGIGKTTSARIIAKALNCIGPDGKGKETPTPCGVCEHCKAISEDRHVDVQEIDAASNTGVDNIREIIDGTRYNPASARYKIYIIDEVHMLSKNAFNALLKTLEEPPERVKFIFATTEIRKVPITVLSRCQRFDLRRIDEELLFNHFSNIAKKENVEIEEGALKIIARLADGSVRDGLSLLDQALSQSTGKVTTEAVREMIGISSKETLISLYENLLKGDVSNALTDFNAMYNQGYDPVAIIQDLLDLTHLFTKVKINAIKLSEIDLSQREIDKIKNISDTIEISTFTLFWQMLLKGIDELKIAPSFLQAAEMILIRMCYFQGYVPTLDTVDIAKDLSLPTRVLANNGGSGSSVSGVGSQTIVSHSPSQSISSSSSSMGRTTSRLNTSPTTLGSSAYSISPEVEFMTINDIANYASTMAEMNLAVTIRNDIRVVKFEEGLIEFVPTKQLEANFSYKLTKKLLEWTNKRWVVNEVSGVDVSENKTIKEEEEAAKQRLENDIKLVPLIAKVFENFPQAKITEIKKIEAKEQEQEQDYEEELGYGYDGDDEASSEFTEEA